MEQRFLKVIIRVWGVTLGFLGLAAVSLQPYAQSNNKMVEFHRADAWDIRCVDYGQRGKVTCDLYLVMNYKPHPDFRAVVMKVFLRQPDTPWVEIDFERQSKPNNILDMNTQQTLPFVDCVGSCAIADEQAKQLVTMIKGEQAVLKLVDFNVEVFDIPIDHEGFELGLQWLEKMQTQYGF